MMRGAKITILYVLAFILMTGCSSRKVFLYLPGYAESSYYSDYLSYQANGSYIELEGTRGVAFLRRNIETQYKLIENASMNIANGNNRGYRSKVLKFGKDGSISVVEVDKEMDMVCELAQIEYYKKLNTEFIEALRKLNGRYIYPQ